ncbi:MAG: ABC transporter ATP-binding protein [Actinobacteria bacterium]|nr:ABC transporter ATP-binding protein [Actinomycetota bacterium]
MSAEEKVALRVSGLEVATTKGAAIVEDVSLTLRQGEILGVVGESGSGKTTTALSLFGYASRGARVERIAVEAEGERIEDPRRLAALRGEALSYVPQDPGTALNPSLRVAAAIEDMLRAHRRGAEGRTPGQWLESVHLPGDEEFGKRYPHQLSGGQQQRVCIAQALACGPDVVVLDEPTTGLDVVTQARILRELVRLRDEEHVAMIYITHDLSVVAQIANRIAVMYAGRIIEEGPAEEVLARPRHPYTRGLLASTPDHVHTRPLQPMPGIAVGVGDRPQGCAFAARCPQRQDRCLAAMPDLLEVGAGHRARCLEWERTPAPAAAGGHLSRRDLAGDHEVLLEVRNLAAEHRSRRETVVAASDVSFSVAKGACVALVGESGSGKTTIARTIVGLHPVAGGEILLGGESLPADAKKRSSGQRRRIQMIMQNPADALNPRRTIEWSIARPARVLGGMGRREAGAEVRRLLEAVRLSAGIVDRYPHELSGGERQRVAIARALAADPEVLVCDEITSALDVSVQAAILELLDDLRSRLGLATVFITHDLGVVAHVADFVLVLEHGLVCEQGPAAEILARPRHEYTRRLLESAPSLSAALEAWQTVGDTPAEAVLEGTGPGGGSVLDSSGG